MKQNQNLIELLCQQVTEQTDRLYRLAFSYVRNEQDAMDIVQDAVCKLLQNIGRIEQPQYINTWLYRVTINTSLDFLRRSKKITVGLPEWESGEEDDYSRIYLMDSLQKLDEKSRAVVILRFF